jgi:hypothetical protein
MVLCVNLLHTKLHLLNQQAKHTIPLFYISPLMLCVLYFIPHIIFLFLLLLFIKKKKKKIFIQKLKVGHIDMKKERKKKFQKLCNIYNYTPKKYITQELYSKNGNSAYSFSYFIYIFFLSKDGKVLYLRSRLLSQHKSKIRRKNKEYKI